jgi:hypothetical protein
MGGAVRRTWIIAAVAVAVIGGAVLADAAVRSHTSDRVTGPAAGMIRTTKSWDTGPSAEYDYDSGNIGVVNALRLTLPAGTTYDVVITVSLDYRTSPPPDRLVVQVGIREGARYGPNVATDPGGRPVASSASRSSTTITCQARLDGGTEYWIAPAVNVLHRDAHARITSTDVLMVVDATPATS